MFICTKIIFTIFLACSWLNSTALAQSNQADYKIGVGDIITINVASEADFSGSFTVRNDGTIFYSYLKEVPVSGMTIRTINDHLTKILANDYISNPIVSVSVKEYASKKVQVLGAVSKPGSYVLRGPTRVLDIISQAGGLTAKAGRNILVIRSDRKEPLVTKPPEASKAPSTEADIAPPEIAPSKEITSTDTFEPIVINYADIVERGKLENNIIIQSGDVINIPKADEVYVLGQVNKPGSIKFESNLSILQAISLAGGTTEIASKKSTYIIRKGLNGKSEKVKIRLDRIISKKQESFPLQANDVIVIPESFF